MRKVTVFFFVVVLLTVICFPVFAIDNVPPDDAPIDGGFYITLRTSQFGIIDVYLPFNYKSGYFSTTSSGGLFNMTNSTLTGFFYVGTTQYTFRLTSFNGLPQYRLVDYQYSTYYDLTVTEVIASNGDFLDDFSESRFDFSIWQLAILLIGLVVIVCLFMRRF